MGLDMFLEGVNYYKEERDENFKITKKRIIKKTLICQWRKANHIHNYFDKIISESYELDEIENLQHYEISKEDILKFIDTCKKVVSNRNLAKELMPTQEGFFFGSTDYDKWYYDTLIETVNELENVLKENEFDYFEYHAWW